MPRAVHLVSRFFSSLHPRAVDADAMAWVTAALTPGELAMWEGLGRADRAESVAVARRTEAVLAGTPDASDPTWIAAALLHDVGKQASAYGPIARAFVTGVISLCGSENVRAWADGAGAMRSRMGRYAAHDEMGAELLGVAGAREPVVAWARAHHRADLWAETGIPPGICRALAIADGETGS